MRFGFVILFLLPLLSSCQQSDSSNREDRYPWQITLMQDGSSRIFGIHLGVSTVAQARQQLGKSPKLALFENADGSLSLELFYKEFTRAGLTGKLVLSASDDQASLKAIKQHASKQEKLESGVIRHFLHNDALLQIDALPIIAMTYMPYANLDEDTARARFGEPAEKIRSYEKAQHWLYPQKGLDLIINESGKEVLQYVAPNSFEKLAKPLRR